MRVNKSLLIPFIIVSLVSCKESHTLDVSNLDELELSFKKKVIEIDENYLSSYMDWHPYTTEETTMLVGYNQRMHSLDFFDLEKLQAVEQIKLEKEGPNAIGAVQGFFLHSKDSVFLFERGKLHLGNLKGEVYSTFQLYDLFGFESKGEPNVNHYFKLKYFPDSHSILFYITFHNSSNLEKQESPLVSEFNIEKKEFKSLPIYHSDVYKKNNGRMGFITYLGFQDKMNEKFIFNFQYDPNIYSLDKNSKISDSNLEDDFSPLIDESEIDLHGINNRHYLTSIPDPWRNVIYRANWEAPKEGKEVSFIEKGLSLSVFDGNLNHLLDYRLPDYTYQINNWFVWKDGLYLNVAHPKNSSVSENEIVFHILTPDLQNH
ncbi:DUF4221 family protein [Arthrospiribacter ruber]|uniref:DUF4221 domain-containing protein n=1 Tax=Arthrospiribacter ruber TaxID=2487934 RepID=A0A951MB28_9BACT|nr:DUF4221 family protein [Arthrospiribacter ruber]MBW3466959.1 DUF4221 domain-containing protein [Arthrospiribacter ruber]